jgi:hypothetical protein
VSSSLSIASTHDPCSAAQVLPVLKAVNINFPAWRHVTLDMLSEEDREAWKEKRAAECPAVAIGDFDGSGRAQFAVLLVSKTVAKVKGETYSTRKTKLLHVIPSRPGIYSFRVLNEGVTTLIPVVYRSTPGQYEYHKDDTDVTEVISVGTDVIVVEVMESSSTAYLLRREKVVPLTLSF